MTFDVQSIFGVYAALLSMGIVLYGTWLVYLGQVRPHIFTVCTWFIISLIVGITMVLAHENSAAWRNAAMSAVLMVNLILCCRNDLSYIKRFDFFTFLLALASIPIWTFIEHKEFALIWLGFIEVLGILPTVRKAWVLPYELNPIIYFATSIAIFCQFLALNLHTLIMFCYFGLFCFLFLGIGCLLLFRRHMLKCRILPSGR